jgi:hypothetical protein
MKLAKLPADLPIDAIHDVTNLLGLFVAGIQDKQALLETASDYEDCCQTLECLRDDYASYAELYDAWQFEANTHEQRAVLSAMHEYLGQASLLIAELKNFQIH